MPNRLLPSSRAPRLNGIPVQPITGLPLQVGEPVYLIAHPITGQPLRNSEEPTLDDRMRALIPGQAVEHPTLPALLSATPLDIDMIRFVAGLYPRAQLDWSNPSNGTYEALETKPAVIAENAYLRAQRILAEYAAELPAELWEALIQYGHPSYLRAIAQNLHCPEGLRTHAGLAAKAI